MDVCEEDVREVEELATDFKTLFDLELKFFESPVYDAE